VLYEVVAEDTNEEGVSKRRYGDDEEKIKRLTVVDGNKSDKPKEKAAKGKYPNARPRIPKAAESLGDWD
jgi:hypothetical protein